MNATTVVMDAYQALLADMKKTAMEDEVGLVAELTYRDDDEHVKVPRIRCDVNGGLVWIDAEGTQIPEAQFKALYVDPTAVRMQIMEDAREQIRNAPENLSAIRNAKGQYAR